MSRVFTALWIILIVFVLFAGYVRLAPADPAKWHVPLSFEEDRNMKGGVRRVLNAEEGDFQRLNDIIASTPRTRKIAGDSQSMHVTYETRTAGMRFPDYTTIQQSDGKIRILGRLRFGRKDFGVNAARVTGWLDALKS